MLHEFKKIDVYELKGMIRRAGLMGATVQLQIDGKNSKAVYLAGDMPEALLMSQGIVRQAVSRRPLLNDLCQCNTLMLE